jgi:uncharacterized protein (DUF1697 family)
VALRVALFRAINGGGRGTVSMEALRRFAADIGLAEARTLLQSGNLVFASAGESPELESLIESAAHERLGLATDVIVREPAEIAAVIAANPYPAMAADDPSHLVVFFMKTKAPPTATSALRAALVGRETVEVAGRELYIAYPDGIGTSRFTNAVIERRLRVRGTARNWNTVTRLAALLA